MEWDSESLEKVSGRLTRPIGQQDESDKSEYNKIHVSGVSRMIGMDCFP
jgi:hypothetical protein